MDRRGISVIIGTLIIVIIAIFGVSGIWLIVSNSVDEAESVIEAACFDISLMPIECETYGYCGYEAGGSLNEARVLVRRGQGEGDLRGIRFVFEDDFTGVKRATDIGISDLEVLGAVNFDTPIRVPVQQGVDPDEVSLVALVGDDKNACGVSSRQISCNRINPLPAGNFTPGNTEYFNNCCMYPWNLSSGPGSCVTSGTPGVGETYCCSQVPNILTGLYKQSDFPHCVEPFGPGCVTNIS